MHASSARRALVRSLALCLLAAAGLAGLGGCGASAGGRPPVDSPIYAFQPVDPDEYAEETDDEDDTGSSDAADDAD